MRIVRANHGILTIVSSIVVLLWVSGARSQASDWQSLESIARTAVEHAQATVTLQGVRVESNVRVLDKRLKLAKCGHALEGFLPNHVTELRRNTIVGVRCAGPKPWKIYVPVHMAVYRHVLVTVRPLHRGDVITASDVRIDERDVATLHSAYLTDLEQLASKILRRSVAEGTLVTIDLLNAERIIRRGQSVTLIVRRSGLKIRMAGTALMDGTVNQRIRVENKSSKLVVEGIVRSHQLVEVVL